MPCCLRVARRLPRPTVVGLPGAPISNICRNRGPAEVIKKSYRHIRAAYRTLYRRLHHRRGTHRSAHTAPPRSLTASLRSSALYRVSILSATSRASERGVYGEAASSTEYRRSASSCLRRTVQYTRGAAGESATLAPCCLTPLGLGTGVRGAHRLENIADRGVLAIHKHGGRALMEDGGFRLAKDLGEGNQ
jgi:hypothetical protein